MNRALLFVLLLCCFGSLYGQNIKGHYVSKADEQGTVYHTFPNSVFKHPGTGYLTFDITYRSNRDNVATVNFTYRMEKTTPADSIRFITGEHRTTCAVEKIYISPEKNRWKHRYSFATDIEALHRFFDPSAPSRIVLYAQGNAYVFEAKTSAWKTEASVMNKIFEMIRINE